jgi:hypothetical protein
MTVRQLIAQLGKVPMAEWDRPVRIATSRGQDEISIQVTQLDLGKVSAIYIEGFDDRGKDIEYRPSPALGWLPEIPRCGVLCSQRSSDGKPAGRPCPLPGKYNGMCKSHAKQKQGGAARAGGPDA